MKTLAPEPGIARPTPIGTHARSLLPLWDARELVLYRKAHSVTQAEIARALATPQAAVGAAYEQENAPIPASEAYVLRYVAAVEHCHQNDLIRAEEARAELAAYREARRKAGRA